MNAQKNRKTTQTDGLPFFYILLLCFLDKFLAAARAADADLPLPFRHTQRRRTSRTAVIFMSAIFTAGFQIFEPLFHRIPYP